MTSILKLINRFSRKPVVKYPDGPFTHIVSDTICRAEPLARAIAECKTGSRWGSLSKVEQNSYLALSAKIIDRFLIPK